MRSLLAVLFLSNFFESNAFAACKTWTNTRPTMALEGSCDAESIDSSRRNILFCGMAGFLAASSLIAVPNNAGAVMMENTQKVFKTGEALGIEASKQRFKEARDVLQYLIDNYDTIAQGGGDNIRRYLGTVGTTNAMYGIEKVLKELQDEADDIVEFTENMSDFDYYRRAADTAAYSSIFVEYSSAKTKPEQFFKDAKKDIQNMKIYMDRLAADIKL